MKANAKQIAAQLRKAKESERKQLVWSLGGDANRFLRQEVVEELTGEKKPLVKCGVNAIEAYLSTGIIIKPKSQAVAEPEAEADEPTPATCKVGQAVIRKECQRKGKITAIDGDKVTVELEDGSKRNPNKQRFSKLYINA